ncbi:hippurate hydrolase [Arcanobacterium pluranimalium]|uniref:amidohydrolase n=1 Tax=Arcanobacterium pluranimalium TaxID=108028 RepID=UPI00195E453A|nr:amidohydrolase [Arcanobacterium pluranimalium]MBM7825155.1 hippurate hydrolase [Arcanobacterium pluranimalium]
MNTEAVRRILRDVEATRSQREDLYKFFHQHAELSMQEVITSQKIVEELESYEIPYQRVGRTGVVAVIKNGDGAVVAFRADIDGLPIEEASGKEYASHAAQVDEVTGETVKTSHACGHDFHIMSLLGALQAFNSHRSDWNGTLIGIFQPAEEIAAGARDMIDNGLGEKIPHPDVYLGQHVLANLPGGHLGTRVGSVLSAAFSVKVELTGRGSHGSMPELSVDTVVLAANIVTRLQQIVSREIAAAQSAVLTVGSIHAGTKSNIIPQTAELLINTRAFNQDVANHLKEAIERVVNAECEAARCPEPARFTYYDEYPLTSNDAEVTHRVRAAFDEYFPGETHDLDQVLASEDFSIIPSALGVPYTFWGLGGFADPDSAPGNHNPAFAPDLQPTLDRGLEAVVVAASAWLVP